MKEYVLIHVPHSSMYLPEEYKEKCLLTRDKLYGENFFMCDFKVNDLLEDIKRAIIFPYSRLYCDVERFKGENETMNKFGMGYIYTLTSKKEPMFRPDPEHIRVIDDIYDKHHILLDERVSSILNEYGKCVIIDLHSYSSDLVLRLFNYEDVPDICIGIEEDYYSEELTNHFVNYFRSYGYTVRLNYPYKGSIIPNRYFGKKNTGIVSIMIEINKRIYLDSKFESFKKILNAALEF